jgi:hypothetical protein
MHTFDKPLLAMWGWRGDIDTSAAYVGECGADMGLSPSA